MPESISLGANFQSIISGQVSVVKGFGNIEDALIKTAKVGADFKLIKDPKTGVITKVLQNAKAELVLMNAQGKEMKTTFEKVSGEWQTISSFIRESANSAKALKGITPESSKGNTDRDSRIKRLQDETKSQLKKEADIRSAVAADAAKEQKRIAQDFENFLVTEAKKRIAKEKAAAQEIVNRKKQSELDFLAFRQQKNKKAVDDELRDRKKITDALKKDILDRNKSAIDGQKKVNNEIEKARTIWKALLKLQISNQISRAFSNLLSELRESVNLAGDLSKSVAQISTIDISGTGLSDITEDILKLSNQTGLEVLDVASAQYQALSNQVVSASNAFEFMATANELAIATLSTSKESVNLLSSTINAYQLSTQDAQAISDSFFKTLELGRVPVSALSETIGRVLVLGSQLGISLGEVQASLALFTRQGIKANQAQTLLRAIMLKLIKPTEKMKDFLAQLGFESGEAAIKTLGFANVMSILEKESQKTGNALGDLGEKFSRVRAITGAAIFQGTGITEFNRDLDAITNSAGATAGAFNRIQESSGQLVDKGFNKIQNALTEGFGKNILETIADLERTIGLLTGLASALKFVGENFKTIAGVLTLAVTPALVGFTSSMFTAISAATTASPVLTALGASWVAATGPIGLAIIGIAAAATAITLAVNSVETDSGRLQRISEENAESLEKSQKKITDNIANIASRRQRIITNAITQGLQEETKSVTLAVKALSEERVELVKELVSIRKAEDRLLDSAFESIGDRISDATSQAKKFTSEFERFTKSIESTDKSIRDTILEKALNLARTGTGKREVLTEDIDILRNQEGEGSLGEQEKRLERVIELLQQRKALESTRLSKDSTLQEILETQQALKVIQQQESEIAVINSEKSQKLADALKVDKDRLDLLKETRQELQKELKDLDGVAKKDKERAQILASISQTNKDINKITSDSGINFAGAKSDTGRGAQAILQDLAVVTDKSITESQKQTVLLEAIKQSTAVAALATQLTRTSDRATANQSVVSNALKANVDSIAPLVKTFVGSGAGFGGKLESSTSSERDTLLRSQSLVNVLALALESGSEEGIGNVLKLASSELGRSQRVDLIESLKGILESGTTDSSGKNVDLSSEQALSIGNLIKSLINFEGFLKTQQTAIKTPEILRQLQDAVIKNSETLNTIGASITTETNIKGSNLLKDAEVRSELEAQPLKKSLEDAKEATGFQSTAIDRNTNRLDLVTSAITGLSNSVNNISNISSGDVTVNVTAPSGTTLTQEGLVKMFSRLSRQGLFKS